MNSKKCNWLFLTITLVHLLVMVGLVVVSGTFTLSISFNLICSELILIVPTLLFCGFTKGTLTEKLGLRKIKVSSALMVVLFTFLTMPLTTVINAISMLFVDNAVLEISGDVLNMPFFLTFLLMAVYGPICEEVVFRGVLYQGYKRTSTVAKAMVFSALLFGIIHMNFNQAPYALVIGVLLVLLVEATGSIYASVIYHVIFNAQTVCMLYLTKILQPDILTAEAGAVMNTQNMLYTIGVYLVIASITTTLAFCVLVWIAKNESREEILFGIWKDRKIRKGKILSVPILLAIIICLSFMIWDVI